MPNFCKNTLVIAGEPEAVEEFRIIQAQHTEPIENEDLTLSLPNSAQEAQAFDMLVRGRHPNDLSFAALVRDWGEDAWGTSTDVAGDNRHERHDRGGWRLPMDGALFDRIQSWSFKTAWAPPERWLQTVAPQFPALNFQLGFDEPGMNKIGVASAHGSSWRCQSFAGLPESKPEVGAMANARRSMAMHRKPAKLLKAVWADDVVAVGSFLRQSRRLGSKASILGLDIAMESPWTALMHAAYAGSHKVAKLLLKEGANPMAVSPAADRPRAAFADICMDVDGHMPARLATARQAIFLDALSLCPELGRAPLASGRFPLALAMRYQMGAVVSPLIQASPMLLKDLSQAGKNAHDDPKLLVDGFLSNLGASGLCDVLSKVTPQAAHEFGSSMVMPLLEAHTASHGDRAKAAAAVLGELANRGCVQLQQWRVATGEDPVAKQDDGSARYLGEDFRAMATAIRAKAAMAEIAQMGRSRKHSHA